MKDHDKLLKEALDLFAQTGADVQDVIRAVADEYNYEITGEMEKIISSIEGMGSLDTYLGVGGTITQSLGDIVNEVHNAYVGLSSDMQGMKDAVASIGYQGKYDTSNADNTDNYIHDTTDTGNSSNTSTGSNSDTSAGKNDNGEDFESLIDHLLRNGTNKYDPKTTSSLNRYIYSKYGSALTVDEMSKLSEYLGFNYTPAQLDIDDKNHSKRKMKMLDELKVHGFSNGGIVPDDALKVRDIGIKPASNGDDRLVALKPKESVFNEKQTKMIQEYVNKTPDYKTVMGMGTYMDKMMKMSEVEKKDIPTQNIMQVGDVSFNLPNVYDYADLMNEAKNDPKFEEMIARIMKHQLGFGSYLKKTNVNFRH